MTSNSSPASRESEEAKKPTSEAINCPSAPVGRPENKASWLARHKQKILEVFTVVLALATLGLAILTGWLCWETRRLADCANDTLAATARLAKSADEANLLQNYPSLCIVHKPDPANPSSPGGIDLTVPLRGPANILSLYLCGTYHGLGGARLAVGGPPGQIRQTHSILAEFANTNKDKPLLEVWECYVEYEDIFGKRYWQRFQFQPKGNYIWISECKEGLDPFSIRGRPCMYRSAAENLIPAQQLRQTTPPSDNRILDTQGPAAPGSIQETGHMGALKVAGNVALVIFAGASCLIAALMLMSQTRPCLIIACKSVENRICSPKELFNLSETDLKLEAKNIRGAFAGFTIRNAGKGGAILKQLVFGRHPASPLEDVEVAPTPEAVFFAPFAGLEDEIERTICSRSDTITCYLDYRDTIRRTWRQFFVFHPSTLSVVPKKARWRWCGIGQLPLRP